MATTNPAPAGPISAGVDVQTTDVVVAIAADGPSPEQLRDQARDVLARALGQPTGNAQSQVAELTDDEVAEVVAAGENRHTTRDRVKQILKQAYDRRSLAAQREAREKGEVLRRRGLAQRVLEQALGCSVPDAARIAAALDPADQQLLAELDGREDVAPIAQAVLDRAEKHAAATTATPEAGSQEPGAADEGTALATPAEAAADEPPAETVSQETPAEAADAAEPAPADKPAKGRKKGS